MVRKYNGSNSSAERYAFGLVSRSRAVRYLLNVKSWIRIRSTGGGGTAFLSRNVEQAPYVYRTLLNYEILYLQLWV